MKTSLNYLIWHSMTALFGAIENCGVRSLSVLRISDTFATSSLFLDWGLGAVQGMRSNELFKALKDPNTLQHLGRRERDECTDNRNFGRHNSAAHMILILLHKYIYIW